MLFSLFQSDTSRIDISREPIDKDRRFGKQVLQFFHVYPPICEVVVAGSSTRPAKRFANASAWISLDDNERRFRIRVVLPASYVKIEVLRRILPLVINDSKCTMFGGTFKPPKNLCLRYGHLLHAYYN